MIDNNFIRSIYTENDMCLLPFEKMILVTYLQAQPKWLDVELPVPFWIEDERGLLTRHGFRIEYIPPFSEAFYLAADFLLSNKNVSIPDITKREIEVIEQGEDVNATKKELLDMCDRHGIKRFREGRELKWVGSSSRRAEIIDAIIHCLTNR